MTTVYFVRHATPNFDNHDDLTRELTAQGLKDRSLVTEFLRDKKIDLVFSSPYKRSVDTVKQFADAQGMQITLVDDFRERKVGDEWIADFAGFSRKQWENFHYKLADGESLQEVQERNIRALRELLNAYANKTIVVGSHGTALSTIINYYDPSWGYDDFKRINMLMPWIVEFIFDGNKCMEIKKHNVLIEK
ncbi:MAG: histidine phosphatase family protein [Clostridia bacterium]|nr:histidine phosphatase family protein [Clostridia bacterium]